MAVVVSYLVVAPSHNTAGTANGSADGEVNTHLFTDRLENINGISSTMKRGAIDGRVVPEFWTAEVVVSCRRIMSAYCARRYVVV
jgi:hypothetical protein